MVQCINSYKSFLTDYQTRKYLQFSSNNSRSESNNPCFFFSNSSSEIIFLLALIFKSLLKASVVNYDSLLENRYLLKGSFLFIQNLCAKIA